MSKRIGPRMQEIADFVSAVPGCTKSDAIRAAGLNPHNMGSHKPLNRAILAGLVVVENVWSNRCALFHTERDRQRFHLRAELLAPGTAAERIEEIRADIERLDAERANTWRA